MSRDSLIDDSDFDLDDAVNDDEYTSRNPRTSRTDTLKARRRVEALLEERRLKQAIDDDWDFDEEDEEE
ncbi:PA3496 family putative envelope integrity protein [Halomonas binhaiensis]|uniref:Uncharacterized protein n=1 Tax=Halomonas binhaiensis TaxID=2562282 RepID=A0A856QVN1_9GAMM|nr:hypothetical protein [Halomonas binhaiensis]QEM83908.2 hypothetical protein E4T21_04170 [Halomonas binhaiensis]